MHLLSLAQSPFLLFDNDASSRSGVLSIVRALGEESGVGEIDLQYCHPPSEDIFLAIQDTQTRNDKVRIFFT